MTAAHRDHGYVRRQLRDSALRAAGRNEALQIGCDPWQERTPVGRDGDLERPFVGDSLRVGFTEGVRGGFRPEQHDRESKPDERSAPHIIVNGSATALARAIVSARAIFRQPAAKPVRLTSSL